MSIVSMVISIVGGVAALCGCCSTLLGALAIPIGGVGAVLGHVAMHQIKERGERGHGMALAGVIVGWIAAALGLFWLIFFVLVLMGTVTWDLFMEDPTFD